MRRYRAGKSVLDRTTFREIADEASDAGLEPPYFIYAHTAVYTGAGIVFTKIPANLVPDEN